MTQNNQGEQPAFKAAYDAGYDAGRNIPNSSNSHFKWLLDMLEWSRGNKDGVSDKIKNDKYSGNDYKQINQ